MYEDQMDPAIPGMKVDSGDDRVETFAAGAPIPFGRVVASDPDEIVGLPAGAYTLMRGAALQTHTRAAYGQFDAVSVLTQGLAWLECASDAALDGALTVDAEGRAVAGGAPVPRAVVRGPVATLKDGRYVVPAEFDSPEALAPSVPPVILAMRAAMATAPTTVAEIPRAAGVVPIIGGGNETPPYDYQRHWVSGDGRNDGGGGTDNPRLQDVSNCWNFPNWGFMYGDPGIIFNFSDGSKPQARAAYDGWGSSRPYIAFTTDATDLSVSLMAGSRCRPEVDGVRWPYVESPGNNRYVNYALPAGTKTVVMSGQGDGSCFYGDICVNTGATITPFDFQGPEALSITMVGDSYLGYNDDVDSNTGFVEMMANMIGVRAIAETGRGSTGYQRNAGGEGWALVEPERLAFVNAQQTSIISVQMGINDSIPRDASGPDIDTLQAIGDTWASIRAANPHALLIGQGPWAPNEVNGANPDAKYQIILARLYEVFRAMAGPWIFLDNLNGTWETSWGTTRPTPRGPWQTGTGNEGAPTGSGNGDTWVQADGTHPTVPVGITGLSQIWAAEVRAALAS